MHISMEDNSDIRTQSTGNSTNNAITELQLGNKTSSSLPPSLFLALSLPLSLSLSLSHLQQEYGSHEGETLAVSNLCVVNRVSFADFVEGLLSAIGTVILEELMANVRPLHIPVYHILSRRVLERWKEKERGDRGEENRREGG